MLGVSVICFVKDYKDYVSFDFDSLYRRLSDFCSFLKQKYEIVLAIPSLTDCNLVSKHLRTTNYKNVSAISKIKYLTTDYYKVLLTSCNYNTILLLTAKRYKMLSTNIENCLTDYYGDGQGMCIGLWGSKDDSFKAIQGCLFNYKHIKPYVECLTCVSEYDLYRQVFLIELSGGVVKRYNSEGTNFKLHKVHLKFTKVETLRLHRLKQKIIQERSDSSVNL